MGSHPSKPSKASRRGHSRCKSDSDVISARPPDDVLNGTSRITPPLTATTTGTTDAGMSTMGSESIGKASNGSTKPQRRMSRRFSISRKVVNNFATVNVDRGDTRASARDRANSLPNSMRATRRLSAPAMQPKPMDLLCGKCFRQMPYGAGARLCLEDRKMFCPPCVEDDMLNHNSSHKLVKLAVKMPESHPMTGNIICSVCKNFEPSGPAYASASCLTCDVWADFFEICAHCLTESDPTKGWNILREHGDTHLPAETVWAYYQPPGEVTPERLMFERFGLIPKRNAVIGGSRRESGSAGVFMGKHGHIRSQIYAPDVPF